jgi:hypothetical protein
VFFCCFAANAAKQQKNTLMEQVGTKKLTIGQSIMILSTAPYALERKGDIKMRLVKALGAGLIGTTVAALIHRGAREVIPEAPRGQIVGMRFWARKLDQARIRRPSRRGLYWLTVADAFFFGTPLYALVAAGRRQGAWARGALIGTITGASAILFPQKMRLGRRPTSRSTATKVMTVAWGLIGGLAAAAAYNIFERPSRDNFQI